MLKIYCGISRVVAVEGFPARVQADLALTHALPVLTLWRRTDLALWGPGFSLPGPPG